MSQKELGLNDAATQTIKEMQAYVDEQNAAKTTNVDIYSKFGEDGSSDTIKARNLYIQGLVHLAQGDKASASRYFTESLEINPTSVWTKYFNKTCK